LATVRAVALGAELRNPHPSARTWLLAKVDRPPTDWDERAVLTIPGVVWTVSSDTCATGRLSAPDNVAYGHWYREFVFRQPRDTDELGAVMSADSEEVFACYRFEGLEWWTSRSVGAWHEDVEVVLGYARHALAETVDPDSSDVSATTPPISRARSSGSTSRRCAHILRRWDDQEVRRSAEAGRSTLWPADLERRW